ncbi:sulfotransferase domain-containing protein [Glycomyces artemisiae]|uniref:Sulfotransferase domain-containing protein n=1 Tax=Glycomyces artemisiae TaxID=1076443 RepID=A0A2T0UHF2_9ACTN|nr:sulfotransferase domain-containing protein [Glycomyces artemisiae]PRY57369.1 sulfotransferase domain-containing protein [Glycomyces artemisiae]
MTPHRYRSHDEDSRRWLSFPMRDDDIVISTRSKHGTTWTQMICALLVFQTPDLPAPLPELSPWLDWTITPVDEVHAKLAAQDHRRFIKTHTPLDGLPIHPAARYIVVARHPLDAAVSLYHQGSNLIRERIAELTGVPVPASKKNRLSLHDWVVNWTRAENGPREDLDMLPGVMAHLGDAWARREEPNLLLVHYADLSADLEGEMRRIAAYLDIDVPESRWPALVKAASFAEMKANAEHRAPDPKGLMRSKVAFFRRGTSGAAAELLASEELAAYEARVADLIPEDLSAWLHRP